jgi:deoxyribonuclease (pyrimidine dimer)
MTRINSSIKPRNLTDQHLIAELRELPRIFTAVNKRLILGRSFNDIPKEFTLGVGHCKFFYDKLDFLYLRHIELKNEYLLRFDKKWKYDIEYLCRFKSYIPTDKERRILIDRISQRILDSSQIPRYYGKSISKDDAIEILQNC